MQEKVYKKRIKDIDELHACILTGMKWISALLMQLSDSGAHVFGACIKAKGGHFEHTLSQ